MGIKGLAFQPIVVLCVVGAKPVNAQVVFNYRAPRNTPQGRRLAVWNLDLVANREILDKQGTLSLRVRDIFNTRVWRDETLGEDFYQTSSFPWRRGQQVTLSFLYRINQTERDSRGRRGRREEGDDRGGGDDDGDFLSPLGRDLGLRSRVAGGSPQCWPLPTPQLR